MHHDLQKEKLIVFIIDINNGNVKRSVQDVVIIVYLTAAPLGIIVQLLAYGRRGLRFLAVDSSNPAWYGTHHVTYLSTHADS